MLFRCFGSRCYDRGKGAGINFCYRLLSMLHKGGQNRLPQSSEVPNFITVGATIDSKYRAQGLDRGIRSCLYDVNPVYRSAGLSYSAPICLPLNLPSKIVMSL
jgi:hypothetical protein